MRYIDEFRDRDTVRALAAEIKKISTRPVKLMEVCGGHTMSIQKFGLPALLPDTVELISGPGCPVCVTSRSYIDKAVAFSQQKDVIITTYGDLIRVPGSESTLEKEHAAGADVRVVYSVLDALKIAREQPAKKVVFLGIGFETTAPGTAVAILQAAREKLTNFFVYSAHKVMPPAMAALIDEGVQINGYIGPGHVSTITGKGIYEDIPKKFGLGVVISGFEPTDLMQSVLMLIRQIETGKPQVEIQYKRAVRPEGNRKAKQMMNEVFEPGDDWWRGLGVLKDSGLKIRPKYAAFDAEKNIRADGMVPLREPKGCICGDILKGIKKPKDCRLFATVCTPRDPVGSCMVSGEGACQAYYLYNR
ncbi:hydrogenase formation protein HypD [Candidatus Sulfidibacterium hydrothermale]|uniref:hydrogenase formation protein HypD n=1 Tax=Candidatus Sulfidibacterium hydrothermale TaxID=2875962 RepID=UPI001F0A2424|nr:hydrogenase formation protein HypD [Candidatus Sulfidibacterium hydrothermale]UBM61151.1 hydrogenase formation protein HypD [Candidatus Sulfidibacterium hydrothermale]